MGCFRRHLHVSWRSKAQFLYRLTDNSNAESHRQEMTTTALKAIKLRPYISLVDLSPVEMAMISMRSALGSDHAGK